MFIAGFGTVLFGLLIGWISYRTLRLTARANVLSEIVITIAIVGGAAIIALLKSDVLFGLYSIGLIIGFFGYFAIGLRLYGKEELQLWQMPPAAAAPISPPDMTSTDIDELS
jgi:vacuolar-type H+-ATPase subunit I/STV1